MLRSLNDVPCRAGLDTVYRPGAGAGGCPPLGWSEAHSKRNTDEASDHPRFLRATVSHRETEHLRVLIADERRDRLIWLF
jgi:hypothetical protein